MTTHDEYRAALAEYKVAQAQFDAADPDRVDEAVYRLRAAELRLGAAILALKEGISLEGGAYHKQGA